MQCPAVECSHSAELHPAAAANWRPARAGRLHRPSNSLISTAVQPASPRGHPQQPVSPKLDRANSVVSHTARPHGRAGTPASMYGPAAAAAAGFLLPGRARHNSPARHLAAEQVCVGMGVQVGMGVHTACRPRADACSCSASRLHCSQVTLCDCIAVAIRQLC